MQTRVPMVRLESAQYVLLGDLPEFSKETMGNLCSMQLGATSRAPTPPHSLEELLSSLGIKEDIAATGLDQAISANLWANKFRVYLRERNLTDDENILKFLVLVQPLKACGHTNNNEPKILGHSKLHRVASVVDQRRLFLECVDTFLSEDSEEVLPLSSSSLWEEIIDSATVLRGEKAGRNNPDVLKQAVLKILEVRKDPGIWDEGIEPTYTRFVKQVPSPSLTACILSIL